MGTRAGPGGDVGLLMAGMWRLAAGFMLKSLGKLGPGDGGNRPGVWPHLIWRSDVSNANARPIGGVA
jgi:hypothetical protein